MPYHAVHILPMQCIMPEFSQRDCSSSSDFCLDMDPAQATPAPEPLSGDVTQDALCCAGPKGALSIGLGPRAMPLGIKSGMQRAEFGRQWLERLETDQTKRAQPCSKEGHPE